MLRPLSIGMIPFLLLLLLGPPATLGDTTPLDAETMKAGLRTAAPEEDGFIDRAVEMVDEGRISAGLVHGTFVWARVQPQHKHAADNHSHRNQENDQRIHHKPVRRAVQQNAEGFYGTIRNTRQRATTAFRIPAAVLP